MTKPARIEEFRRFLIVDEGKAIITVDRLLGRLEHARALGFDWPTFASAPTAANEAARAYLAIRRERGATVHAFNNDVKLLNCLARYHHPDEHVHFRKMREPRSQFKALSDDQIETILAYRAREREADRFQRALLLWALKSGMRPSEVAAMDVSDLDPHNSRFYVRRPAKGGLRRWLPIEPWVWHPRRPLAAWLRHRPIPDGADADALWTTTRNGLRGDHAAHGPARRVRPEYLRQVLGRIGNEVHVHLSFTICRHTRATELRRRGWDLLYLQTYLGHAAVTSTQVYAKVRPQELDDQMRRRPGTDYYRSLGTSDE